MCCGLIYLCLYNKIDQVANIIRELNVSVAPLQSSTIAACAAVMEDVGKDGGRMSLCYLGLCVCARAHGTQVLQ